MYDHHSDTKSADFSAATISATTIRYRKLATGKLQGNTNVYRWSDGSTTMTIGDRHFELESKALAPPRDGKYNETKDSLHYIAAPSMDAQILFNLGHLQGQYTIKPNKDVEDDALEKLQKSLAAANRKDDKLLDVIPNMDPELQKKQAEAAEREWLKAQRRREIAAEKASLPSGRRAGGGLTVDDLEGRGRRAPATGRKPRAKKPRVRGSDYDTDDELPRGGRNREDEYDKEDDFLASSDEDMEEPAEASEEEEEEEEEDSDANKRKSSKHKSKKMARVNDDADADADADLMDDDVPTTGRAPSPDTTGVRGRKRQIIDDDDDE